MEIKYINKIIAFIDVLGFSNLVYSKTNDPITKYFEYVLDEFTEDLKKFKFEYYLISDSVVVYTIMNESNFKALVMTISKLQMKLITRGIIVRGGISTGELFVDKEKNIIVGPGLINAYSLENKAIYPRIIIDRKISSLFYSNKNEMIKKNGGRICFEPPKGYSEDFPYIDYTYKLALVMQIPKLDIVKKLLSDNLSQNQNVEKYLWLKIHITCAFEKQKNFLTNKRVAGKTDAKRLKLINDFIEHIHGL